MRTRRPAGNLARLFRSLGTLNLLTASFIAASALLGTLKSASTSSAATSRLHVRYLAIPDPYMEIPAVYGNSLAWAGIGGDKQHPQPERLYLADLQHFHPRVVTRSKVGYFFIHIHVSPTWLSWMDQSPRGDWSIRAMNRHTGRIYLVDSASRSGLPPHSLLFPMHWLSGDTVAWSRASCTKQPCIQGAGQENWTASIQLKRLPNGPITTVIATRAPCNETWPSLWGRVLVWQQEGVCNGHTGSDVLMFDRTTGRVRVLTTNHRGSEGTTNGRYVAWKDAADRFWNGVIMLMDLRTGQITVSSHRPLHEPGCPRVTGHDWDQCAAEPIMGGDVLTWLTRGGGMVVTSDLQTGQQYVLDDDAHGLVPNHIGQSWGKRVVWEAGGAQKRIGFARYIGVADVP